MNGKSMHRLDPRMRPQCRETNAKAAVLCTENWWTQPKNKKKPHYAFFSHAFLAVAGSTARAPLHSPSHDAVPTR